MTTKLDGELRRELQIGDRSYTLTLSPAGFLLALKGRRKGLQINWPDLVSGEAALATALNASLTANLRQEQPVSTGSKNVATKTKTDPPAKSRRTGGR